MHTSLWPHRLTYLAVICTLAALSSRASGAAEYSINIAKPADPVVRGKLELGGAGKDGHRFEVTNRYIERDGKPFIPVVGEFHYSRYPRQDWLDALRKMKAGGVGVVATYVFWGLHEPEKGKWDWSGNLDVRAFVEDASKAGLDVILRIGPFGHGEMRNGGLPDWLYGQPLEIRSNDPAYLKYTEKLYQQVSDQVRGLLFKEGGPIIGVQLENEFQHSAAPWEIRYTGSPLEYTAAQRDVSVTHGGVSVSNVVNANSSYGQDHMANLKKIAKACGLDVPLYTATGWGNASIVQNGSLPVSAAYAYPFWAPLSPSPFYLFKDLHHSPDYMPVSYIPQDYPSIAAEMGAGIQPIYRRRPFVPEASIEPLIIRALGSGSNGVGYYMYHGGANPMSQGRFVNEDASGLPKINYDYQAPIGEYGKTRAHYQTLRLIHHFLDSFGERLAPMQTILPETNQKITADNVDTLRYAVRSDGKRGFLFFINFQDHAINHDIEDVRLNVSDCNGTIHIPESGDVTIKAGLSGILPINFDVEGVNLRSATVQPLTTLNRSGQTEYIFFAFPGVVPELVFQSAKVTQSTGCTVSSAGDSVIIKGESDQVFSFQVGGTRCLVIPRALALEAYKLSQDRLIFTNGTLTRVGDAFHIVTTETFLPLQVYPKSDAIKLSGAARIEADRSPAGAEGFDRYIIHFAEQKMQAVLSPVAPKRYVLTLPKIDLKDLNEVFLTVDYVGDTGMAFIDGKMVDDHFYFGRSWEIGLKRFLPELRDRPMVFVFQPMQRDATYLQDLSADFVPVFSEKSTSLLEVKGVMLMPEYKAELSF